MEKISITHLTIEEISHLELWLSEGAGVTLHDTERAICDELLPNYYGDVLLQAGIPSVPIYQKSATRRQIMMGVSAGELIGNPGQLPFANESIDVLVAQHLLDVGARPQFLSSRACKDHIADGSPDCHRIQSIEFVELPTSVSSEKKGSSGTVGAGSSAIAGLAKPP